MRFKKVIVVNPPNPPGYVSNKDSMGGFGQLYPVGATYLPPLDLVYLISYLNEKGISMSVLECLGQEMTGEDLKSQIGDQCKAAPESDFLVLIRTSLPTIDWDLSVLDLISKNVRNVKMGIYGPIVPHVLARIQKEESVEFVLQGEPDDTVLELMNGESVDGINGLTFRKNGEWQVNSAREFRKDLNTLPFPKWEMLPYKKYTLPKSAATAPLTFLPMLTSRGCPYGCHYCPYPVAQGLPFRYRSAINVVDEIEYMVNDLGIQYILFRDPVFSQKQGRVIEICDEIKKRGLVFSWHCETRPDCLNEETIQAMASAGCKEVNFGMESAEVEIQIKAGRKPITHEQIIETVGRCHRAGMKVFCFFIIGLPGDTVETIMATIQLAINIKANWVQFTAATPFVGTKLRGWAVSSGLVEESEYGYVNSHEAIMGNENLSKDEIKSLLKFAKFQQSYLINRKGILKDKNRTGVMYQTAKSIADAVSDGLARTTFALAKKRFEKNQKLAA